MIDPTLISIAVSKLKPNSPTLLMVIDSDLIIFAFGKSVSVNGTNHALEKESYYIVLLDRGLPDGDGIDFCSKLRQDDRYTNTPILMITAKDKEPELMSGLYAGADDYLFKPVRTGELKARVFARL
jgi:DNA-binding response OmpR family regulator